MPSLDLHAEEHRRRDIAYRKRVNALNLEALTNTGVVDVDGLYRFAAQMAENSIQPTQEADSSHEQATPGTAAQEPMRPSAPPPVDWIQLHSNWESEDDQPPGAGYLTKMA